MRKKKLWKDIFQAITHSWGRFFAIFSLMLLGTLIFIGLKVAGPDMRSSAESFFERNHLADISILSTYGLDESDRNLIETADKLDKVEYGYFKDVVLEDTTESLRIFSAPDELSQYEVTKGRLPAKDDELALDVLHEDEYKLGDTLRFSEEKDAEGKHVLKQHTFKIVGFVKSSELISRTEVGQTNVGTGELDGYAVVPKSTFDSDVHMIARLQFSDTKKLNAYSDLYSARVTKHKDELKSLLKEQPAKRLSAIKENQQKKVDSSEKKINKAKSKMKTQQSKLEKAKTEIQNARAQLDEQRISLSSAPPEARTLALQQINQASAEIDAEEKTLTRSEKKLDEEAKKLSSSEKDLKKAKKDLDALALPSYTVKDRKDNSGYKIYLDNTQRVDILSNVFPVFLFAIAALVALTTMTRFVEEERINMGTFKALGYSNSDIRKKFIVYGFVSAGFGAIIGIVLGHLVLPKMIFNAYASTVTFTELELHFSLFYTIIAFAIAIGCTVLAAYLTATKELKEQPAQLLLPKPPAASSRILLERIPFIWKRMSFTYKVTARNLFRYKKRMFMTIFGVAGCTALLMIGFGLQNSLSGIVERQFGDIVKYDLIVVKEDSPNKNELQEFDKQLNDEAIRNTDAIHFESLTVPASADYDEQPINLIVPEKLDDFSNFVDLQNRKSGKKIKLTDNGVVISERLAKLLNVSVGDKIQLADDNNKKRMMEISAITEMYMGHFAFMNNKTYENIFQKAEPPNASLVSLRDTSKENVEKTAAEFIDIPAVKGVQQNIQLSKHINTIIDGLDKIVLVLIGSAAMLATVVIYNLTNINVSERIRELSTIKVLGFFDKEVTLYIYRETIILSVLGILAGFAGGYFLHGFIISSLPPDDTMFSPELWISNFVLSAGITMLITLIIMIVMHYRIKHVNMLDALKSVE